MMIRFRFAATIAAPLVMTAAFVVGCFGCGSGSESPAPTSKKADATSTSKGSPTKPQGQADEKKSTLNFEDRSASSAVPASKIDQKSSPFRFADISKDSGVDFKHVSGMTEAKHFPSANGSGLALFDYDGDGKLDIYFATATYFPLGSKKTGSNKLYKSLGNGKYQDVTESAGVGFAGFCHGAIAGDFDNDGDQDLFLATYHQDRLYENLGNGKFQDITEKAGIMQARWTSSGCWFDYDNDGDLDLYASSYGKWDMSDADHFCGDVVKKVRLYCNPRSIATGPHALYRNNGNKTFTNVYDEFLVNSEGKTIPGRTDGRGFGMVAADVNQDGLIDLYIANDMCPNFLFLNKGKGKFEDATELSGAAFDEKGQSQSGMGADCNDVDGDGRFDLFCTNFANEYNTLYLNLGNGSFMDNTAFMGLAAAAMPWVGWGCCLEDLDSDGWPDCLVANGHVDDNRHLIGQDVKYPEPPLIFQNTSLDKSPNASRRFEPSKLEEIGPYFASEHVARGLAYGDLDNDGDIDFVINHKDDAPAILINQTALGNNRWLQFKLTGTKSNRDAVGAKIEIKLKDRVIHRQRKGGCSLMSTNDGRVSIGLGATDAKVDVIIRWPSGVVSDLKGLETNKSHSITEPK